MMGKSFTNYSLHLPKGWRDNVNMAAADQQWLGSDLFSAKGGKLTTNLKLWWNPPEDSPCQPGVPKPESFHRRFLFLWMSRCLWRIDLNAPKPLPIAEV